MNKTSPSRSNSSSSLDQPKEENKKQPVVKNAAKGLSDSTKNSSTASRGEAAWPGSGASGPVIPSLNTGSAKSAVGLTGGLVTDRSSKANSKNNTLLLSSSIPTLSPRPSSSINLGANRSLLIRNDTNKSPADSLVSSSPSMMTPVSTTTATNTLTITTTTSATANATTAMSISSVDQKKQKIFSSELASQLIKAETAVQGIPYKKQMTASTVDRILRGKIEDNGINLIKTQLIPFVEKQFDTSEYGNLFRNLDKQFLKVQPDIEELRNSIKAEMKNPVEFTDALLQKDPRLAKILDPVISPLINYITSDGTINGSNLPAPFMQLLKEIDNEILKWQKILTKDANKSGGVAPLQADVDTARKNAMVALIGIRSLSVMMSKLHGSQVGGIFSMLENHLIKTINKKCVSLTENIMCCPNDKFEELLVEKRGQHVKRKHSMRMNAPDENSEKLSSISRKQSQLSMSPRGSVQNLSESEIKFSDEIIEHNKMLLALFVKKYELSAVDKEFSFEFQKKMIQFIDEGGKKLGEKAVKKDCLKLLTSHMKFMKLNGQQPSTNLEKLYEDLSGHSFRELEDDSNPNKVASPKSKYLKKQ